MTAFLQVLLDLAAGTGELSFQTVVDELVKILEGLFGYAQEKLGE